MPKHLSARLLGLRGGSVNRTFKGSSPSGRGINPHESTSTPAVKIESGTVPGKSILTSVPGLKSTVSPELISNSAGPSGTAQSSTIRLLTCI